MQRVKTACHIQMMSPLSSYCGRKGHGQKSPFCTRKNECPAYNRTCKHCNHLLYTILMQFAVAKKNSDFPHLLSQQTHHKHHEPQWMKTHSLMTIPSLINHRSELSSIHSAPCPSPSSHCSSQCFISLDHHTYNQLTDTWIRQASKPQSLVKVIATVSANNYEAFELTIIKQT